MLTTQSAEIKKIDLNQTQSRRSIPLRLILIAPFVTQIFIAVGLTGYLAIRNGQQAVNDLASRLRQEVSARVEQNLATYLAQPWMGTQMVADAIDRGQLNLDLEQASPSNDLFFLQAMRLFEQADIIYIGTPQQGFLGGNRSSTTGKLEIMNTSKNTGFLNYYFDVSEQGERTKIIRKGTKQYDARTRPWYKQAVQAKTSVWSEIYPGFDDSQSEITASRPIFDRQGNLLAVAGVDILLEEISKFLKTINLGRSSEIFIIERDANIVASSAAENPFIITDPTKPPQRLAASASTKLGIQAATQFLQKNYGQLTTINSSVQHDFYLQNEHQFLQVTPFQDQHGLDWLIVVVVPESEFMEQININTRTTIFLCLLALAIATISGIYTSRWILSPINRLNQASQEIAKGNLNQQIQPENIQELDKLGQTFNEMSCQLQAAFSSLENTNTELEQRVAERTEELQTAKQLADNANQAKSEFLANMSHELRTPLNGILGYAQILGRSKIIPEKERHGVNIIHQCGSHLLTLINDILDISKIEARRLELIPQAVHLPALLQGVVEISQIRAQQKSINFHYEPDANLPKGVIVDEKRLRQVLINLLGNAIKFTDRGSITFRVNHLETTTTELAHLRFTVIDTGVGIAAADVQKLFRAFEQVGEKSRQSEGTGLGLAISQQIIQLMGGEIRVNSQLGVGSEFFFEVALPLHDDWIQQQSRGANIIGYKGERKQILIVDDRWENRSVIVNLLEPLGFIVAEAEHGQDGLEKMRELQPDLVITDLAMPVMNGFEMLEQLRQSVDLQHLTVVVSSASVSQLDQQMSIDAGGDDFLAKPVHSQELFDILAKHLKLTWDYQKEEPSIKTTKPISAALTSFVIPDPTDLQLLLELAQEGRLKKLMQLGVEIATRDQSYQPFVDYIHYLAKQFQSEKIEEFIQQAIHQSLNPKNSS